MLSWEGTEKEAGAPSVHDLPYEHDNGVGWWTIPICLALALFQHPLLRSHCPGDTFILGGSEGFLTPEVWEAFCFLCNNLRKWSLYCSTVILRF